MLTGRAVLVWVLAALLCGPGLAHAGGACSATVLPGQSIQAAIDAAPDGAVLCLAAGDWDEHLTITKSVTLRGEGAGLTAIRPREADWPIVKVRTVRAEAPVRVVLENLVLTRALGSWEAYGVLVQGSAEVTLQGCTLTENAGDGIHVMDSAQLTIVSSTISENHGHGIMVRGSARLDIDASVIWGNARYGICSDSTGEVRGQENELHDNGADLGGNVPGALRAPLVAATETRIVYPDPRYPSLQHAVDALVPGGRLILQGGEHTAGVTITKEVEIASRAGETVVLRARNPETPVLSLVGGAELTMTGLTLTGGHYGLFLAADARATVRACTITQNRGGIELWNEAGIVIDGSSVSGHTFDAVRISDAARGTITGSTLSRNRCGVYLLGSARVHLERTTISRSSWDGVRLSDLSQASAIDCTISESDNGILLQGSSEATILRGTVSYSSTGIALFDSAVASLESVRILDSSRSGIDLHDRAQATVVGCTVARSYSPVFLTDDTRAIIVASTFSEADIGIMVRQTAKAEIRDSTIRGCADVGLYAAESASVWITGSTVSGNQRIGVEWASDGDLTLVDCTISGNAECGIETYRGHVRIESSRIISNQGCGVSIRWGFKGMVSGRDNTIPSPGQRDANLGGAVCPDDLAFLMTEEGGELDRRE